MALPSKTTVQSLDYASLDGAGCFVVSKTAVDTKTLDYPTFNGPFFGIGDVGTMYSQAVTALVGALGSLTLLKFAAVALSAAVGAIASMTRLTVAGIVLAATCGLVGTIRKDFTKSLSASVATVASIIGAGVGMVTSLPIVSSLIKQIGKTLSAR